jgi:hypothetical protein
LIEVDKAEREKQRQGKAGTPVSDEQWQRATHERYLDLAAANESHFAPSNTALVASSGKSVTDNKAEWEKNHKSALEKSQTGDMDQALAVNSFADHFLTDAFSAGHLFNKRDVMEAFAGKLPKNAKGDEFTAGSKVFFDKVAHQAFTGAVKDEFSKFETVEFKGVIFRPNIDSESRFSALLQGIQMEKPELLESAIAKAVHDTLNKEGVPVENDKGESWPLLSGDGKLNEKTLAFGRKAVAQSQLNVLDVFKRVVTLDLPALFKKVWAYVPRPTKEGQELIKKEVASGTDPRSASLIAAVVKLIKDNFKLIIDGLVKLGKLKKA